MTNAGLHSLAVAQLRESPLNPRKHFDAAALAELTESVRTSGIAQDLLFPAASR